MSAPLILAGTTLIYAGLHSLLATLQVKAWVNRRFGRRAARGYRLFYNLFAGISGFPILVLYLILPDQLLYRIPFPWVLLTTLGQFVGILVIVVGILQTDLWHFIGVRQMIDPQTDQAQPFITAGLYQWVRHPLYTGALLLIWFFPIMTVNLLTLFIIFSIYLVVGAKWEEGRLLYEFGDAYRAYQKRVPMLLPRWRRKSGNRI